MAQMPFLPSSDLFSGSSVEECTEVELAVDVWSKQFWSASIFLLIWFSFMEDDTKEEEFFIMLPMVWSDSGGEDDEIPEVDDAEEGTLTMF